MDARQSAIERHCTAPKVHTRIGASRNRVNHMAYILRVFCAISLKRMRQPCSRRCCRYCCYFRHFGCDSIVLLICFIRRNNEQNSIKALFTLNSVFGNIIAVIDILSTFSFTIDPVGFSTFATMSTVHRIVVLECVQMMLPRFECSRSTRITAFANLSTMYILASPKIG